MMVALTNEEAWEMKKRERQPEVASHKPTKLYRHFDADGRLLYVGISLSVLNRTAAHKSSGWSDQIATITIQNYPTRPAAEIAEQEAIATEGPIHNKNLRSAMAPDKMQEIRDAIARAEQVMRADGLSEGTIRERVADLRARAAAVRRKAAA